MIDIYAYTSQGGRTFNEDFVGYVHTDDGAVVVLSDGVGDVSGGDIASRIVVESILDEPYECASADEWLASRLALADRRVRREQEQLQNQMKSTVVALRISGDRAVWGHAGDSRLYYIHNGTIAEVTADHSLAFKKYLAGQITRNAITADADRDRLLSAVGGEGAFSPELGDTAVCAGDAFVLCSDGAWGNLIDQEVAFDYLKAASAKEWAYLLLLRIVDRMDPDADNLSVITVRITD